MFDVSHLWGPLAAAANGAWQRFSQMLPDDQRNELTAWLATNVETSRELATVFALSDFAADVAVRQPPALLDLLRSGAFRRPPPADLLGEAVRQAPDVDVLKSVLRLRRNAVMLHIIWRDLNRHAPLAETTASVTRLADQFIDGALARLYEWAIAEAGEPIGADSGTAQRLVVVALGKLGAGELNLSSDVDLIFAYPEPGTNRNGGRTNQQFFLKLSQRLIQVLDTITTDGFVFRVDMRLRPYGDSGALVLHFDAIEQYYEEHGRDWERYAWIRARPCAGDRDAGQRLIESLRPFVFRRYLDFGAIQALRVMKARIDGERDRLAMRTDIKLGPGGIREVEFIAQMRQLIWGGRQRALQCRGVVETLAALAQMKLLPADQARRLASAYEWLRNVEHRLQAIADQQTQTLPTSPLDQARIAYGMACPDYASFVAALDVHRQHVSAAFDTLLEAESAAEPDAVTQRWHSLWLAGDLPALVDELAAAGYSASSDVSTALDRLRAAHDRPQVGEVGRTRLDALVPRLLVAAAATAHPELALTRVVPLLEATLRRSAYYMLLLENPAALATLVDICGASRWMAEELSHYPALLDELLDPALLYTVPDIDALRADLRARLEVAGHDGDEAELEALRAFKETHQFRVAACEVRGILKLMNVSDYLTYLAEVILDEALNLAWEQTARAQSAPPRAFAIIGFGKLGGLELGPGSDLDIVFVHALDMEHGAFLQRMVRRLLHILTTRTHSGALYDVDTRLRPSGRDGTMVISLAAFERYQQEDAWAWEHQALVRARPVAGDAAVGAAFNRIRRDVLRRPRDRSALRAEIVDMRRRIGGATSASVDLKREPGGIVDIEFMVQYLVLASASVHERLTDWTDNVRILETAAAVGLIDAATAALLKDAYLALRSERHREALDIPDDGRAREVLDRYGTLIREQWRLLLMPDIA